MNKIAGAVLVVGVFSLMCGPGWLLLGAFIGIRFEISLAGWFQFLAMMSAGGLVGYGLWRRLGSDGLF